MLIYERAQTHLQYDAELALLRSAWTGVTAGLDFTVTAPHLSATARRLQARLYLLEVSSLLDISMHDNLWLARHWLPDVATLPLERVAILIDPTHAHNNKIVKALVALGRPFFRFKIKLCDNPEAALRWLTGSSSRVPELLAEWQATFPHEQYLASLRALGINI